MAFCRKRRRHPGFPRKVFFPHHFGRILRRQSPQMLPRCFSHYIAASGRVKSFRDEAGCCNSLAFSGLPDGLFLPVRQAVLNSHASRSGVRYVPFLSKMTGVVRSRHGFVNKNHVQDRLRAILRGIGVLCLHLPTWLVESRHRNHLLFSPVTRRSASCNTHCKLCGILTLIKNRDKFAP